MLHQWRSAGTTRQGGPPSSPVSVGSTAAGGVLIPVVVAGAGQPQLPPLPVLPVAIWERVLALLDAPTRIGTCMLVCSGWRAAAVAVTRGVVLDTSECSAAARHARAASLQRYLEVQASSSGSRAQLTAITICGAPMSRPLLRLALGGSLARLQELSATSCRLTLGTTPAAAPTAPAAAPTPAALLTSLCLRDSMVGCELDPGPPHWPWPALVSLQRLELTQPSWAPSLEPLLADEAALTAALQQLTRLTALVLRGPMGTCEAPLLASLRASLAALQQLRELRVSLSALTAATLAAAAPSCLTLLEVEGAQQLRLYDADPAAAAAAADGGGAEAPGLRASLAALQQLSVEGARGFDPALLLHMPRLTALRLRTSSSRWRPDGVAGTRALLAALPQLGELAVLDLRNTLQHQLQEEEDDEEQAQLQQDGGGGNEEAPAQAAGAPPAEPALGPAAGGRPSPAYSALTSCSRLVVLDVSACRFLPGTFPLLFNPCVELPLLRQLKLYQLYDSAWNLLQPLDVAVLAGCCPALVQLSLHTSGHTDGARSTARLETLTRFSGLTCLTLAGRRVDDALVTATLAHLSTLRRLRLYGCPAFTATGLRALTTLRRLTYLLVETSGLSDAFNTEADRLELGGTDAEAPGPACLRPHPGGPAGGVEAARGAPPAAARGGKRATRTAMRASAPVCEQLVWLCETAVDTGNSWALNSSTWLEDSELWPEAL